MPIHSPRSTAQNESIHQNKSSMGESTRLKKFSKGQQSLFHKTLAAVPEKRNAK
jgi:hypothetical protein